MRRINDETPIPIRELNPETPEWLCAIIGRLMAKDKADRFTSADDVHELLESCLSHAQQPTATRLPEIPRAPQEKSKSPVLKILVGVLTMVTAVTGLLLVLGVFSTPQQEQGSDQEQHAVNATQDGAGSQAEAIAYKPSPATQKMLDDLVKEIKSKKSPWGDSDAAKHNFWTGELREATVELIRDRLQTVQAGKVKDTGQTVNELRGLAQQFQAIVQPNEASYTAAGELAAMSWPLLLAGYPRDFNETMVELTVPYPAIRVNDKMAEAGRPTEPLGWDVQAAHAIALARAGKTEEALKENQALTKKED